MSINDVSNCRSTRAGGFSSAGTVLRSHSYCKRVHIVSTFAFVKTVIVIGTMSRNIIL